MNGYNINFYPKEKNHVWDDRYQLKKIAPYDDAEYFWAYTYNQRDWTIVFDGKVKYTVKNKRTDEVTAILEGHNQNIKQKICHN